LSGRDQRIRLVAEVVPASGDVSEALRRRQLIAIRRFLREISVRQGRSEASGRLPENEHDVVIARGRVRKRKKKPSKPFRDAFGHTPLSIEENIPWGCRRLVVGTGADGALPVMDEVKREAARRRVQLLAVPTSEAIRALQAEPKETNAILHVTC
jgi:hypothetical protein